MLLLLGTWALKRRRSGDLHSRCRVESSSKAKVRRLVDTAESLPYIGFLEVDPCVAATAAGDEHRTRERRSNNYKANETIHAREGRTRQVYYSCGQKEHCDTLQKLLGVYAVKRRRYVVSGRTLSASAAILST